MIIRVAIIVIMIVASLVQPRVVVPETKESVHVVRIRLVDLIPARVVEVEPEVVGDRRVMRITAYTSHDRGMNGRGITASGERVQEGRTIAADENIPFGTEIHISALDRTYTVTDRGGAISRGRLDLYMESRKDALAFGVQELEVVIQH